MHLQKRLDPNLGSFLFYFAILTVPIMKGDEVMILFITLALILALLVTITVLAISIGGASFIIIFGDVIVCIFIIIWIIKRLYWRRR